MSQISTKRTNRYGVAHIDVVLMYAYGLIIQVYISFAI